MAATPRRGHTPSVVRGLRASIKPHPFRICGAMRPKSLPTIWRRRHRVHLVITGDAHVKSFGEIVLNLLIASFAGSLLAVTAHGPAHADDTCLPGPKASTPPRKPLVLSPRVGNEASLLVSRRSNAPRPRRKLRQSRRRLLQPPISRPRGPRQRRCSRPSPTPARNSIAPTGYA